MKATKLARTEYTIMAELHNAPRVSYRWAILLG